jgi:hypothetical protein
MYGILNGTTVIAKFVAPLSVKSNVPVFVSDALSLKRTVTKRNAQRWEISTNLEPLSVGANDLFALLVNKGASEVLTIQMPQNYGVIKKRVSTASPNVDGLLGATNVNVSLNNGLIPAGTFIRFSNHSKIYMVTADFNQTAGIMSIFPGLLIAVPPGQIFKHQDDVEMLCRFDTDVVIGMQYTDGILMDVGTVNLIEAL